MGLDWCPNNCNRFDNYQKFNSNDYNHECEARCILFNVELVNVRGTQSKFYRTNECIKEFTVEELPTEIISITI